MSFKRVADDFDDFKLQKKRRVNDLLLDAIPSDEVILVKNGKLACLVCSHKPVFDTTAMLSIHRHGKKHLANSLVKLERAKEDAEIRQKREHERYLKLKKNVPENPLLGLTKLKTEMALKDSPSQNHPSQECASGLQGNSINQKTDKPFFGKKTSVKFGKSSSAMESNYPTKITELRDKTFEIRNRKKDQFLNVNPLTKQNYLRESEQVMVSCGKYKDGAVLTQGTANLNKSKSLTFFTHDQHSSLNNLDEKSKAQYLSKLRQIGWILGTDGKWEKDKDAEFESDEDEPPSPRTVLQGS